MGGAGCCAIGDPQCAPPRVTTIVTTTPLRLSPLRVTAGAIEAAGIAGHSTRIGAAYHLVKAGFDVAAIANAGGWKSLMMPNYYTHELRAKQSAMAQLIKRRGA